MTSRRRLDASDEVREHCLRDEVAVEVVRPKQRLAVAPRIPRGSALGRLASGQIPRGVSRKLVTLNGSNAGVVHRRSI